MLYNHPTVEKEQFNEIIKNKLPWDMHDHSCIYGSLGKYVNMVYVIDTLRWRPQKAFSQFFSVHLKLMSCHVMNTNQIPLKKAFFTQKNILNPTSVSAVYILTSES